MAIQLINLFEQAKWQSAYLDDGGNTVDKEWLAGGKDSKRRTLVYKGQRKVESGRVTDVIYTHPRWVKNGTVKGFFPWIHVPASAVFVAEVGFIHATRSAGNVTFQVWEHHYEGGIEVWNHLISHNKRYDGTLDEIKFNLGEHLRKKKMDANSPVSIELRVDAGSTANQDLAVWIYPRIEGVPRNNEGSQPKEVTLQFDGKPLKHFFVTETNGLGADVATRQTDERGKVFISPWEDSIRVYFHNNIVSMADGDIFNHPYYEEFWSIEDNRVVNLGYSLKQRKSLEIAIECQEIYEATWQHIYPFTRRSRGEFPLRRGIDAQSTRAMRPHIWLSFPDKSISTESWVEPAAFANAGPLIHLKNTGTEQSYSHARPTLAEELAHALHFSLMNHTVRWDTQWIYLGWLMNNLHDPTHNFGKQTHPFIAFIEAVGIFARRYDSFSKNNIGMSVKDTQKRFIEAQQQSLQSTGVRGDDVEGAVYAAIFVDFADKVGFDRAIGTYLTCNKTNFNDYREFILLSDKFSSSEKSELQSISQFWGLSSR